MYQYYYPIIDKESKLRNVKYFPKVMEPACRKKAWLDDVGKLHSACMLYHPSTVRLSRHMLGQLAPEDTGK